MRRRPAVALTLALAVLVTAALVDAAVVLARPRERAPSPFASVALRHYLRDRGGNVTAAAYDMNSGATYLYRPGVREQTASIVKVDILATLLHETQGRGGLSGAQRAVARGMIEASDNDDATTLWDEEGGAPAVQAFDDMAGMRETSVSFAWGLTATTPRDQLRLLRLVTLPNRLLSRASRDYEYDLMRHVIPFDNWGVSAGLGVRAVVALKNGWLPVTTGWQVNSIGQVSGSGRRYLIAVMTDQDPTESYGIDTIAHISAAAWQTLTRERFGRFSPPPEPTGVP